MAKISVNVKGLIKFLEKGDDYVLMKHMASIFGSKLKTSPLDTKSIEEIENNHFTEDTLSLLQNLLADKKNEQNKKDQALDLLSLDNQI